MSAIDESRNRNESSSICICAVQNKSIFVITEQAAVMSTQRRTPGGMHTNQKT